jgi:hypothetical protein
VTPADLSVLPSGKSESGMYVASGAKDAGTDYVGTGITYPRPLATPIANSHIIDADVGLSPTCPGPGSAKRGYLCLYGADGVGTNVNVDTGYGYSTGGPLTFSTPSVGADLFWFVTGTGPYAYGEYTVTAP